MTSHPAISGVDRRRDDFERTLLDRALGRRIPVLGICRGMQLANVCFGGTLIPDIEEAGFPAHRSKGQGTECSHPIVVPTESWLRNISGTENGMVNSSHHQAVGTPGSGLRVAARAADGIIEALEMSEGNREQFFLLVQWHPERMGRSENPFSRRLLEVFFNTMELNNRKHSQLTSQEPG
jgi:putative glutamine amidotransferase